jgi:hypothetical protein
MRADGTAFAAADAFVFVKLEGGFLVRVEHLDCTSEKVHTDDYTCEHYTDYQ